MKKVDLMTITGEYWHFHPIGTGIVFTYHTKSYRLMVTCNATGVMINTIDLSPTKGYETPQKFKEQTKLVYLDMIEESVTSRDIYFYDQPTYVGIVEIDFKLIKN